MREEFQEIWLLSVAIEGNINKQLNVQGSEYYSINVHASCPKIAAKYILSDV